MGKKKPRSEEKEAIYQAKQVARRERIAQRTIAQAPIKEHLKSLNCSKQEIGSLFRSKCSEILAKHRNPIVVRFCYPLYPTFWIKSQEEAAPYTSFVRNACVKQRIRPPLYMNNIGGYVLYLMADEASARFVRELLPQMNEVLGKDMRVPSMEEIKTFHAGWMERSPKMFSQYVKGGGPCFHNATPKNR